MSDTNNSTATNLTSFIWKVAEDLWGDFKHTDFSRIILPLLLIRRLECVMEPTREPVREMYLKERSTGLDLELILPSFSKLPFFNTSQYDLASLGATDTADNLEDYVRQFSKNVRVIFEEFKFSGTIEDLEKAKLLFQMVSHFANIDLHPDVVSDRDMSNIYEGLIRKFAASVSEKAGEFMTPKDVVRLATKLVLHPDEEVFTDSGVIRSIYDPTCGVAGFLSDAIQQIFELSPTAKIVPFGQELDPTTHALALTSMMIQGFDTNNIKQGNTLSDDLLPSKKFHYGLANPPFGIKWEKAQKAVTHEHQNFGYAGRFGPGLPRVSDGSMLFLLHLVSKMEEPKNGGGRIGIVLSGSPLFTGDAGSGESEIRRWLLEQDYVETILALPNDMFFNTGIGTYVWILSNKKEPRRKNKVQLINLSDTWTAMRKSEGTKRRTLSEVQIDGIVREYDAFTESAFTKIFDTTDFAFRKVTIQRPLRAKLVIDDGTLANLQATKPYQKLTETQQAAWLAHLESNQGEHDYHWAQQQVKAKNNRPGFGKTAATLGKAFTEALMVRDSEAELVLDGKGQIIVDSKLKDTESVPFKQDIETYFESEVLPHVPDAFIDHSVRDEKDGEVGIVGYEINFNRYFYQYVPPRSLHDIDADLKASEARIQALLEEVAV